jgi:hypothetical protein
VRHALLVLALVALVAPVAATGDLASRHKTPRTVLAIEPGPVGNYLVRLDAHSLKPLSKRLWLGGYVSAWALSADRRRLALAGRDDDVIRIVDTRRLKQLPAIRSWNRYTPAYTPAVAWLAPRRLVWLGLDRVFAADPVRRKRLPTAMLEGALIMSVQRVGNALALLLAPTGEIGPARLAVVGADGRVRIVRLDSIRAGTTFDPESMEGDEWRPGLAIAPGRRAFVVGTGEDPIAEVDLRTLTASYHRPERRWSLLTKAKHVLPRSFRRALWLGDGRLAVWGSDSVRTGPDRVETTPIGLSIIDTQDWTIERVDAGAEQVALAGDSLLTTAPGTGLTAYSTDGQRRYQLFDDESVAVQATFGPRAFVFPYSGGRIRVVDARNGHVLGTRRGVPSVLHEDFAWW